MLNEALNVVRALDFERAGEVVMLKELLEHSTASGTGHWSSPTPTKSVWSCSPTAWPASPSARATH